KQTISPEMIDRLVFLDESLNGEKAFAVYTGDTKGQKKIDKPGVCAIIKSFNIGDDEKSPVSAALQRGSGW
ncbi:MAG: hypothetical protein LUF91_01375, partial [Oscillospiraceae bacterium]|nr:hypothetical protein [Oscillospiraceae bacterium]